MSDSRAFSALIRRRSWIAKKWKYLLISRCSRITCAALKYLSRMKKTETLRLPLAGNERKAVLQCNRRWKPRGREKVRRIVSFQNSLSHQVIDPFTSLLSRVHGEISHNKNEDLFIFCPNLRLRRIFCWCGFARGMTAFSPENCKVKSYPIDHEISSALSWDRLLWDW